MLHRRVTIFGHTEHVMMVKISEHPRSDAGGWPPNLQFYFEHLYVCYLHKDFIPITFTLNIIITKVCCIQVL